MSDNDSSHEPPKKRAKLGDNTVGPIDSVSSSRLASLKVPISPPPSRSYVAVEAPAEASAPTPAPTALPSPFQLTRIKDLPSTLNVETVSLTDILGDPLIAECWEFNYLHDIDMLMGAFDEDIRDSVKVHVVHGFWKQEEAAGLKMQAQRYPNVKLHCPHMPEMFGTHHTKMMVLLRHDDLAQIIIHTANLINRDWANMSQAVWRSPLLPFMPTTNLSALESPIGSGARFKIDFLNYLAAYDTRRIICAPLIDQLQKYDFSKIRAALVGSVPGRHSFESDRPTKWGWQGLQQVLKSVSTEPDGAPDIVVQVSSIASLGGTDKWLDKTLFKALGTTSTTSSKKPKCKIIFPTPDEIRRSLDGYQAGGSIHTKIQSPAQAKQLQYLKPLLYHWAGDGAQHAGSSSSQILDAGRKRAAPHIKTYVRFADAENTRIDWALVTSANISKQAWGESINSAGEIRISSFELGVLVWPGLFGNDAKMVPSFKTDVPPLPSGVEGSSPKTVVGFRMPYDLPLVKYTDADNPWCATASYTEPDWMGNIWQH